MSWRDLDAEAFYAELVSRNADLMAPDEQELLRATRFVIAGCGSTGGACVMPLVRSGARRFVVLDPGRYELANLNRQDATTAEIGANKAAATAARIRAVQPFAEVEMHEEGVLPATIAGLLRPDDLVVDAVDVTTRDGIDAKLALHDAACAARLRVLTAYDIATTQLLELFDYSVIRRPLDGRVRDRSTPDRVLRALIPPRALPRRIFAVLVRRRADPERPFPQLAMTATLLGAIVVPYVLRVLAGRPVRGRLRVDLEDLVRPPLLTLLETARRDAALLPLWWRLR